MSDEILDPITDRFRPGISWIGVLVGLALGIALGLFYSWQIDPIIVRNISPADLRPADRQMYIVAAAQEYASDQNLQRAVERLIEADPEANPFETAANTVCDLIRTGQIDSITSIGVIRNLRSIYEPQGVQSPCDTSAFNTPVPVTIVASTPTATFTPSLTPVASKTPTQPINAQPISTAIPTSTQVSADGSIFRQVFLEQFCDPVLNGVIEIYVRDASSVDLPGVAVEASWANGQRRQVFYTGLKPERGNGYADFGMETGQTYRLSILNETGQPTQSLEASTCDEAGTLISYRVIMQRIFPQ